MSDVPVLLRSEKPVTMTEMFFRVAVHGYEGVSGVPSQWGNARAFHPGWRYHAVRKGTASDGRERKGERYQWAYHAVGERRVLLAATVVAGIAKIFSKKDFLRKSFLEKIFAVCPPGALRGPSRGGTRGRSIPVGVTTPFVKEPLPMVASVKAIGTGWRYHAVCEGTAFDGREREKRERLPFWNTILHPDETRPLQRRSIASARRVVRPAKLSDGRVFVWCGCTRPHRIHHEPFR